MAGQSNWATALTIAGSDSGGGAGIQADLKTFAALNVHGTCAVTCITAQNPGGVFALQPCQPRVLRAQLDAVEGHFTLKAAKCGMLCREDLVVEVIRFMKRTRSQIPLVVDPVLVSSSGTALLSARGIRRLRNDLLPLARLVTPNVPEAELLLGASIRSLEDLRQAAREIYRRYGCGCLAKGGHLTREQQSVDFFYDGRNELLLEAPRTRSGSSLPGTGCTTSAAIAAFIASGRGISQAVREAKQYITRAIASSMRTGRTSLLNHFG